MNSGQIVKAKVESKFVIMPNEIVQDINLSLRSKGLLSYLLSLPPDWVIYKTQLYKAFKTDGRRAIDACFEELSEKGYIIAVEQFNGNLRAGYNYVIYPVSQNGYSPECTFSATREVDMPRMYTYKENNKKKKESVPTLEEVELYFQEKGYSREGAKRAWDYYEAGGWIDSHGTPVRRWRQKMISVWFKPEYRLPEPKKNIPIIDQNDFYGSKEM